jgi:hypothetical protein
MQESDTYLAILEEGEEKGLAKGQVKAMRECILVIGEEILGPPEESFKAKLGTITDLDRLKRMVRRAATAKSWQEILDTV